MVNVNSDFISGIDIITQVGMIEPIIESVVSMVGVSKKDIEIVGSFARKNFDKENKPCIDLMVPVDSQEAARSLLSHFESIPGPSKNKGYMIEIMIGWGWVGIMPAIRTSVKNYYQFVDYEKDYYFMTNPVMHINYISNFGIGEVIKGIKRDLHNDEIEINSFLLEVMVIDALRGFRTLDEKEGHKKVLEYLVHKFSLVDLMDPSNKDNIISKGIREDTREMLRIFAVKALRNSK